MSLGSGFFPFYSAPGQTVPKRITGSGALPYMVVQPDGIGEPDTCTPCASGGGISYGVITTPTGDPNNAGVFASGQIVEVSHTGIVPMLLISGTYAKGDPIVASTVYGYGKKLGTESGAPMMIIGTFADLAATISSGSFPQSVQLGLSTFVR